MIFLVIVLIEKLCQTVTGKGRGKITIMYAGILSMA